MHTLPDILADVRHQGGEAGIGKCVLGTVTEKAIHLSHFRRKVSLVAAKTQSASLIGRVSKVGESFRKASKRKKRIESDEESMKEERRTFCHAILTIESFTIDSYKLSYRKFCLISHNQLQIYLWLENKTKE